METSSKVTETWVEESENKVEQPKTNQMVGIKRIFKDKTCLRDLSKCPQGWNLIHKHCFLLSEYETTWISGQESCKMHYSTLAKFNFPKEMEYLMQQLKHPSTYWIGLNKLNENKTWKWADGSVYKEWYKIEDNGDCVYIDRRVMNSSKCEKNKKYICSKRSFCL
ncbi:early activation antigen CD69-like [Sciurus carolinensis]|uniref:early activation antigen CD69-like n=1 Tax=Sciurus carolinensis TaxID=30640 RepID=UPI001FB4F6EA|nr:early activation antigen CD69-like [Sciurus carolinensis]